MALLYLCIQILVAARFRIS